MGNFVVGKGGVVGSVSCSIHSLISHLENPICGLTTVVCLLFNLLTGDALYAGIDSEKCALMSEQKLEKKFGQSPVFVASTLLEDGGALKSASPASLLKEAIHVISCGYEDKTDWGKEVILLTLSPFPENEYYLPSHSSWVSFLDHGFPFF